MLTISNILNVIRQNYFPLLILTSLFFTNATAQVNIATRIGLSTLNEVQIEAAYPLNKNRYLYSNFAYAFRGFNAEHSP